ncbi:uncharacterized protein LOC100876261 [Megachile rotundata]|uniref:uncharacterized protein LOC100876261 n=1 Tax=Megachile rotundata TaxID=143995 RepID=UPI003FD5D301
MNNTKKWNDILEELLQCCVCLDIPDSMVLQCSNGHLICDSCRRRLELCPICSQQFIQTKCLLAEDIISRMEDIKMSIAEEIVEKLQQREQQSVFTQTTFVTDAKCTATQTDDNTVQDRKVQKKQLYQCQIGRCNFKTFYKVLLQHLTERHRNVFYNIYQEGEVISENFVLDIDKLPRYYDLALIVNNMNLFFLKIKIHNNGQLVANLQVVDKNVETTLFQYRFLITDGSCYLRRRGMVTSCLVQRETAHQHSVRMDEKEMSTLMRAKSIECTIIIKKCVHPMKIIDATSNE